MSNNRALNPRPDQAEQFLAKIAADRDEKLHAIERALRDECARVRREAYTASRAFHRDQAQAAREGMRSDWARELSRLRADIRRRRWQVLQGLQTQVLERLLALLEQAWRDPQMQWAWCKTWLDAALAHANSLPLDVSLGEGTFESVRSRVRDRLIDQLDGSVVRDDPSIGCGLVIAWGNHVLDGALRSQMRALADDALRELATSLHTANDHEHG